ncbi:hypothetical protein EMCRGX_G017321 [Ephydatia muelleri]
MERFRTAASCRLPDGIPRPKGNSQASFYSQYLSRVNCNVCDACLLQKRLPLFITQKQAAEVGCRALVTCMNVIGYKQSAFTSLWHSAHWTSTSFSKITIALGAGHIPVGTRVLSSERQGHSGDDAATRSTTHLVQASLRRGSSRGCVTMFEQTTHFNSFRTVELFWLANGG